MTASPTGAVLDLLPQVTLDLLPVPVFLTSVPDGRILRCNQRAVELCGGDAGVPDRLCELLHGLAGDTRSLPVCTDQIAMALQNGAPLRDTEAVLETAGRQIAVSIAIAPIRDAGNRVSASLTICQDITDRRQNEQTFRDSERRYREIVETANEEMIGQRKWDFMFGEDVAAMKALFERRRQGVAEEVADIRFRHHDGREIWTLMAARPLHNGAGRFIGALDLFSDITERRRAEQALRDSEERFRTLADNIAQLAWMADETGRVFWYNRRWFEYTGRTLEEMQGWGWQKVHHPDHVQSVIEKISRCFETGEIWEDTFPLRARDGTYRWFLSQALPIRDERGAITRWFGTNTDVTDRREAEEALLEADRRKDEFLAVLAHELRSPLAPILTAARILQMKGPPDPQLQKPRETIVRQTLQLSKLVDDLLDVGRITAGKLSLDKRRVELNDIVKQAVETCAPVIERRRHTLKVGFSEAPVYLDVDAARMVQVVGNLLNNAAKYMQEGGRIHVTAFADGGTAVIRVRDEGVGIPPEMLGRIFQRFIQLGSSGHRAEGGLGIGLSLVKALVDLHGGSVDARSDGIGTGSEFTVRLPMTGQ